MNPAALKAHLEAVEGAGTIIVNEDAFSKNNLKKAGYESNPLEDDSLDEFTVFRVPMTSLTVRATEDIKEIMPKDAQRAKNLFALGLITWMYGRPTETTVEWINEKFATKPAIRDANLAAFRAGWNFGETTELLAVEYEVKPAPAEPGTYKNINGAQALALGLIAASMKSGLPLFYASYPITPASELLHELSRRSQFGVTTMQAEDEIAAVNMILGAAFGGQLGVTATSGPGMDLKAETIGLAVAMELPLVICDVQRAGPSTGMPTKTEAADLMLALYGRHGESPLPVVAASTPGQCFEAAIDAVRIAVKYRTPVILLSDTFLANSSEPWQVPKAADIAPIEPNFASEANHDGEFWPYERDENLARPWAIPGTPGLQHRLGGLEKEERTGSVSYDADNHARMTQLRADKVAAVARDIPPLRVRGDADSDLLVLGWGSTFGTITAAATRCRRAGHKVATAHLHHLSPLPSNTGEVLRSFKRVLVPEMNTGQLVKIVRAEFLVDAEPFNRVTGHPIATEELEAAILERI